MRLSHKAILALAVGAGAALGYLAWGVLNTQPDTGGTWRAERPASRPQGVESEARPFVEPSGSRARAEPRPGVRGGGVDVGRRRPSHQREGRAPGHYKWRSRVLPRRIHERAVERANRAAEDEPLSREAVGEIIADSFALLWPEREFSDEDYEQLTDAVLRIRAARRALGELPVSAETAEFIERERRELMDALAQFEVVAGVSPSELPDVIDPEGGISPAEEEDNLDEVQELLSDYPQNQ